MKIMKQIHLITLMLVISCSVFAWVDGNSYTYVHWWDVEFDSFQKPPAGKDSVKMFCLYNGWKPYGDDMSGATYNKFNFYAEEVTGVWDTDSLYLKMIRLFEQKNDNYPRGMKIQTWIKAVRYGNILKFPDDVAIGCSKYTLVGSVAFGVYFDSLFDQRDTVYINSVNIGKDTLIKYKRDSWENRDLYKRAWPVEYQEENAVADYDPETGIISGSHPSLLVSPNRPDIISNKDLREEVAFKDFKIYLIADEPESLPAPEAECLERYEGTYGDWSMYVSVFLDVFTEDGRILNCDSIYTAFYYTDCDDGSRKVKTERAIHGFSPVREWKSKVHLWDVKSPEDVEVMCYYVKEDGTRVESPRAKVREMDGVRNINAENGATATAGDGRIYDLAGRPVRHENLVPGLYIRNGRKFLIYN